MMRSQPIAEVMFTDVRACPVYEGTEWQYASGDDGEPVYGVWFLPLDEANLPVIVEAASY
jgi:hypothetical protein